MLVSIVSIVTGKRSKIRLVMSAEHANLWTCVLVVVSIAAAVQYSSFGMWKFAFDISGKGQISLTRGDLIHKHKQARTPHACH